MKLERVISFCNEDTQIHYFCPPQAFLGQLIFGEAQITLWWVGISLTFSGLLVLQRVSPQDGQHDAVAKDE